jgi:hypothetical protein
MYESPRPDELGEQRTPVAPEPEDRDRSAADPRSEPGPRGTVARMPYWFIVLAVVAVGLVALFLAYLVFPPR